METYVVLVRHSPSDTDFLKTNPGERIRVAADADGPLSWHSQDEALNYVLQYESLSTATIAIVASLQQVDGMVMIEWE